ncbi:uncharacterized protein LOC123300941 [Chrysoperla carnea]|uniref:uncharacterized protein LOC123300941 n=1 Tax=Chrysoperla carnea TaxID=189513 RepID=UPI001D064B0F|nr:uncharacterized protein LOC123300941 [Chrysoperla carnea]
MIMKNSIFVWSLFVLTSVISGQNRDSRDKKEVKPQNVTITAKIDDRSEKGILLGQYPLPSNITLKQDKSNEHIQLTILNETVIGRDIELLIQPNLLSYRLNVNGDWTTLSFSNDITLIAMNSEEVYAPGHHLPFVLYENERVVEIFIPATKTTLTPTTYLLPPVTPATTTSPTTSSYSTPTTLSTTSTASSAGTFTKIKEDTVRQLTKLINYLSVKGPPLRGLIILKAKTLKLLLPVSFSSASDTSPVTETASEIRENTNKQLTKLLDYIKTDNTVEWNWLIKLDANALKLCLLMIN